MGFQAPKYRLKWPEGHELHGLELSSRGLTIAELRTISAFQNLPAEQRADAFTPLAELFAEKLISWTYEDDDGQSVKPTLENVLNMDIRVQIPMITAWMTEVSSIPAPLAEGSASGQPFRAELPPMDLPSPNLTNLSTLE